LKKNEPRVEVIRFEKKPPRPPDFHPEDLLVLDRLETAGEVGSGKGDKVLPTQMLAHLILLLFDKGVVTRREFLDELGGDS